MKLATDSALVSLFINFLWAVYVLLDSAYHNCNSHFDVTLCCSSYFEVYMHLREAKEPFHNRSAYL